MPLSIKWGTLNVDWRTLPPHQQRITPPILKRINKMTAAFSPIRMFLTAALLLCSALPAASETETTACPAAVLDFGFYAFFEPVSFSAGEDPESPDFDVHRGYEADLLDALEAMDGDNGDDGLTFARHGIALWEDIWLKSASPEYDLIGGGITILDSRTRDADDALQVAFTAGHITFRQSLLVRAADQDRLASHAQLTRTVRVGALPGTTGEFRLLELTGLVDENGTLAAGVRVHTPQGSFITDGSADYVITPAAASPALAERQSLYPPSTAQPQVVYLGSELGETELLDALHSGAIDAIARGEIGNINAAHTSRNSDEALVVTALDEAIEYGGFTVDADDPALLACLDERLDWLTDERRISYAEWIDDPTIFMHRAELWNAREH